MQITHFNDILYTLKFSLIKFSLIIGHLDADLV
jgi:hypothetical protein